MLKFLRDFPGLWRLMWHDRAEQNRHLADRAETEWYGATGGAPLDGWAKRQVEFTRAWADLLDAIGGRRA